MSYTYAVLKVSPTAYAEIKKRLEEAGYEDQFHDDDEHGVVIDMHGIALAQSQEE